MSDESGSSDSNPGVDGPKTPEQAPMERDVPDPIQEQSSAQPSGWRSWYERLKPLLGYLPTGTHEEDTERDGFLSYSVEVHASVIGLAVGIGAATTGETQLVMALVAIALGVGRVQQQFSETVRSQILTEPWYAIGAAAVGYGLVRYDIVDVLAGLTIGV